MNTAQQNHSSRFAFVLAIITLCFAQYAMAGPPLICHAFEIGQAKSLPLASGSWNLSDLPWNPPLQPPVRDLPSC